MSTTTKKQTSENNIAINKLSTMLENHSLMDEFGKKMKQDADRKQAALINN